MAIFITVVLLSGLFLFYYNRLKKENEKLKNRSIDHFKVKDEMKLSLLLGLYHRYKKEEDPEKEENPLQFERFVAKVMERYYSGETYVTRGSGDYGVDIEHSREDGLYLGQVKCYAPNHPVNYEPIAIIHSQMVKQGAAGGFVVTTSQFTSNAIGYAENLDIQLIDGITLVNMWISGAEKQYKHYLELVNDEQKDQSV
ncbi:restriction system protein [Pullulanibacillus pueri]|uniref:Restriction endonuclease type IV Mrr domain-containing protein n=1 Tax=Pullulanibacillus pueri TaxID=1437324 RepID=A0A8J2ZYY2_9BACL|nr:restriction endonuclease [Pullulanibacillus pueri]MBM7680713.1 restriction system protein [Pullulanibacillus pueri]GGH87578.1 hypothetical protein GCM10007096_37920 [Pullulanibacillus pueri]